MKKFLLTLIVCIVSLGLTYLGLHKYGHKIFGIPQQSEQVADNETDNDVNLPENSNDEAEEVTKPEEQALYTTSVDGDVLEKDYKSWKEYNTENIELSYDFKPIDIDNSVISKEEFLNKLQTGVYIPLKVNEDDFAYKLHPLSDEADEKIKKSIKGSSLIAYQYFKKEGMPFPDFKFTDLNGNVYKKSNTSGKIKVIKCWFINCVVCVKEFPQLNELYDRYEVNENILFLSLAFDEAQKLKKFLSKKQFRYPVIANQKEFMQKTLEIKQYPTHIIVDEDDTILKMVNNVDALITIVDYLVGEQEDSNTGSNELNEEDF